MGTHGMRLRTIADIATTIRARRIDVGLSQSSLAAIAGVSRKWLVDLEAGKASVEVGLLLRVLDALDMSLAVADARPSTSDEDLDALLDPEPAQLDAGGMENISGVGAEPAD